jgi:hypothetical protein
MYNRPTSEEWKNSRDTVLQDEYTIDPRRLYYSRIIPPPLQWSPVEGAWWGGGWGGSWKGLSDKIWAPFFHSFLPPSWITSLDTKSDMVAGGGGLNVRGMWNYSPRLLSMHGAQEKWPHPPAPFPPAGSPPPHRARTSRRWWWWCVCRLHLGIFLENLRAKSVIFIKCTVLPHAPLASLLLTLLHPAPSKLTSSGLF